jgi:hypothetical protein
VRDIVVFREPKLKPLPIAAQDKMRDTPLLVRLQTAKTAIEACYDLSELLRWKDQAAAIAAAAKAAKMPDIAKGANRICKEALLRLGQLLLTYSGVANKDPSAKRGRSPSDRARTVEQAGISEFVAVSATRFAAAPSDVIQRVLDEDRIPASPNTLVRNLPRRASGKTRLGGALSDWVLYGRDQFGRTQGMGLSQTAVHLRRLDMAAIREMPADEKNIVRAKVIEVIELLDAIEEACK